MSTPRSWSGGGGRQVDEVRWSQKVTEMGWGTDKDEKGKKGGHTMTNLLRRVKDLEHVPCASEEEERSAVEKAALGAQAKKLHHLGRTYRYTMNMFITAKECAPSKLASHYDPVQ